LDFPSLRLGFSFLQLGFSFPRFAQKENSAAGIAETRLISAISVATTDDGMKLPDARRNE